MHDGYGYGYGYLDIIVHFIRIIRFTWTSEMKKRVLVIVQKQNYLSVLNIKSKCSFCTGARVFALFDLVHISSVPVPEQR